ncbi:hypothetical protein HELRODRAFT_158734 [Helobdella robusta]|uniref:Uncharacterized protein n=1 Tax=Helobdella robusta TaxID=6412 RepID=T1EN63_HELRO|nr:hypothetical protein HELRODRAFT_158734 [Helobdella robusta]ESO12256.1 hypothetical protein HELRODRAFT_158734 [Helobdella robusta]
MDDSTSFRLCVPQDQMSAIMDPELWPEHAVIHKGIFNPKLNHVKKLQLTMAIIDDEVGGGVGLFLKSDLEYEIEDCNFNSNSLKTETKYINYLKLRAAEARQRIHVVMLNFNNKVDKKLDQLVYVQPTGVMSVRTEYLVRSRPLEYLPKGKLNPIKDDKQHYLTMTERARLRTILNEKII